MISRTSLLCLSLLCVSTQVWGQEEAASEQSTAEEPAPAESVPASEKPTPAAEEPAPAEPTPASEEPTPTSEEPAAEEPAPAPEEPTPTPTSEQPAATESVEVAEPSPVPATVAIPGAVVAPGSVAAPETAAAPPDTTSVTMTNDFEIRYGLSDDKVPGFENTGIFNSVEQVNRFTAKFTRGPWGVYAQLDEVALFANRYKVDDVLYYERNLVKEGVFSPMPGDSYVNVEKLQVKKDVGSMAFEIGDFYAAFARGTALNINRNVDIDIDTSIQGVQVLFRPGAWDITALIGQLNRQQVFQDNRNQNIRGDLRHSVAAVRAERFGVGPASIGGHVVLYDFVQEEGLLAGFKEMGSTPDAIVSGLSAEIMGVLGLDWFLGANVFNYTTDTLYLGKEPEPGYALYGSASAYIGATTWLFEAKRYSNAERINALVGAEQYEIAIGPTLEYERAITEDSSSTLNSNDVSGGRVQMDWSAVPGQLTPYVALAVLRDEDLEDHFNAVPETIVHPMLGVEWIEEHWAMLANVGYRTDFRDGGTDGQDRQLHGDVALKFPFIGHLTADMSLGLERYQWGNNMFQQVDYLEMETAFSILKGSDYGVIWYTDFTNNQLVESVGNLGESWYGAIELQVKPTSALTMKAFYGAYKAGIRCSGGQCRLLPGFEGARVSVVGAF